jgi:hypothetical protein
MAARIVSPDRTRLPPRKRDTVAVETFAKRATSLMFALLISIAENDISTQDPTSSSIYSGADQER